MRNCPTQVSLEPARHVPGRRMVEGIILGGTELPLILNDGAHNGVPFLDTTRLHVKRIVAELEAQEKETNAK